MDKQQIMALDRQYYMPVFNRYPVVFTHGTGPYVYDSEGKEYLDFLAGIAVNCLGHAHPQLTAAIADQAAKLIHCSNLFYTEPQARLAKRLADASGLDRVFLANSGAEANEGAIKLARKFAKGQNPHKTVILTAEHCFHGRTLATLTATAQPKYQQGYEPLPAGFGYIPFNDLTALKASLSPATTCAVMLEPIQGEGGVNVPDPGYLAAVRKLCDETGTLLIFDEIQTGMGRTGSLFAYQQYGVKPDILTLAKGLAGGVPIGAFLAGEKVAAAFKPGDHGTTFGGNPLACAAANAVLDVLAAEDLVANARQTGAYLISCLEKVKAKYPALIREVRGKGLIVGLQLTGPGRDIVDKCLDRGLIINCTAGDVLRLVPPLIITGRQVDQAVGILDGVLAGLI